MDHPQFVEHDEPEDVFTLLSDDNRIDILRALWNSDDLMTFSALHDAVDIRDSGQFNYHLDKLVGQFVTKTEEGYELTAAGWQVNGAIEAGSYTAKGRMEPIAIDPPCPACDGSRTFYYENEVARVECDTCDVRMEFPIPPSTFVNCNREDIPTVAGKYLRTTIKGLDTGFCAQCDGPVERTACHVTDSSLWDSSVDDVDQQLGNVSDMPVVEYECLQCGREPTSGLPFSLLTHPEVVGFHYDRGIDIRRRSIWEFTPFGTEHAQVTSNDPFRASVSFIAGDDKLTLIVDEEITVLETTVTTTAE
ncbi:winged helix-turn-helix domain-containing protein [Halovenus rubra]|uniref:Winged helix-turn-helix domain-containing protein n=2 Tax=Halovenus rubra TaxID=869890 RepID=A0ACC7DXM0_9EURY|nr:helix-turn-helix domain-containing protein [Halovenus rubra]